MSGCGPESAPLRVAVLVSGGVDSSLALKLVTAAGHQATAFYLQIWFQEDFRNFWDACPWEEDLQYAQQVCDALGVPLVVVPLTQQYWDRVVSHSVAEIKEGRTPNPDMLCNSRWVIVVFALLKKRYDSMKEAREGSNKAPKPTGMLFLQGAALKADADQLANSLASSSASTFRAAS